MIPRDLQDNFHHPTKNPDVFIFILSFFKDRFRYGNDKEKELPPCC